MPWLWPDQITADFIGQYKRITEILQKFSCLTALTMPTSGHCEFRREFGSRRLLHETKYNHIVCWNDFMI